MERRQEERGRVSGKAGSRRLGRSSPTEALDLGRLCSRLSSCPVRSMKPRPLCTSGSRVGTLALRLLEQPPAASSGPWSHPCEPG